MSPDYTKSLPTVLLRHELPNGTHHYDWLIAQDPAGSLPLWTWRLNQRVDTLKPGQSVPAERLPDHRALYLDYEGPIAGGRGSVAREAMGCVIRLKMDGGSPAEISEIELQWQNDGAFLTQRLSFSRTREENWSIACAARSEEPTTGVPTTGASSLPFRPC